MKLTHTLLIAAEFAATKHAGMTRKGSSEPYICHPLRVAQIVASVTDNPSAVVAGILHDVVEDTDCTIEQIEEMFGREVAGLVAENTDDPMMTPNERKAEQLRLMPMKSELAQLIKVADTIDNGSSIISRPPPWRRTSIVGYIINKNKQVRASNVPHSLLERWEAIWTTLGEIYPEVNRDHTVRLEISEGTT